MAFKPYKISDLIKGLQHQLKESGDLPVYLSIDEEGNAFNPVGQTERKVGKEEQMISPFEVTNGRLIIYPG